MKAASARRSAAYDARTTPGRPRALKRDEIIEAALRLILEDGHEALSMRAIAQRLQTGAATLYNYFPSQGELDEAIVDRMLADIRPPEAASGQSLREQLIGMTRAYRDLVLHHPQFDTIAARAPGLAALRLLNETLRVLVGAGVPVDRAGLAYALLRSLAHNQAVGTRNARRVGPAQARKRWAREMSAGQLDLLNAFLDSPLFAGSAEDAFRRSVEITIDRMMPELGGGSPSRRSGPGK